LPHDVELISSLVY